MKSWAVLRSHRPPLQTWGAIVGELHSDRDSFVMQSPERVTIMGELAVQKKEKESVWDELQKVEDRIMRRAYDIFRSSGSLFGRDLDNWLTAERELIRKPAIEVTEKDNQFEIRADVAGFDPKDLSVEVTPDDLLVKGEKK